MVFYEFSHNSPYEKNWVFALNIHAKSHLVSWHCPECGRSAEYPAGSFDVTVEGGSAFPDFLGCGAFPLSIVSARVLTTWRNAGIDAFRAFPVGIADVRDSKVQTQAAPKYFRIEVTGEFMVDFAKSGISITGICRRCGEISRKPPVAPLKPLEGSWDGAPLFRDHRFFPSVTFCTEKVKELSEFGHHTNVFFKRMT